METVLTLETYSLKRNAAIARISYAQFDIETSEIFLEKHLVIDSNTVDETLFDFDMEVLDWISKLDVKIQQTFVENPQIFFNVLNELNKDNIWETNVWCNTAFDAPIILNAYNTLNFKGPTMYKFKDIGTLSWMAGFPMIKKVHNGKDDIFNMITLICNSYNKIKYGEF